MGRETGTCAWWKKSYGFITPAAGGKDVFVAFENIEADGFKALALGQQVSFERSKDQGGRPCAVRCRLEEEA
jgi:cold shock protein